MYNGQGVLGWNRTCRLVPAYSTSNGISRDGSMAGWVCRKWGRLRFGAGPWDKAKIG